MNNQSSETTIEEKIEELKSSFYNVMGLVREEVKEFRELASTTVEENVKHQNEEIFDRKLMYIVIALLLFNLSLQIRPF